VRWRIIDQSEAERFDQFLAHSATGDIRQTCSWGQLKVDWLPLHGLVEDNAGQILAACSLLIRHLPLLGRTMAYSPRGPVISDWGNQELVSFTIRSLTGTARSNRAILLKIDPAVSDQSGNIARLFYAYGFRPARRDGEFGGLQPRYTFILPLAGSIEDIFWRFSKKLRYKIKYARQRGLEFRANDDTSIEDFFKVMAKTGERSHFIVRAPEYFHRLYRTLKNQNRILLLTGYLGEEPVVSSITLLFGDTAWAVYGGQDNAHRNLYTYHAMNWERIRWSHAHGARRFDFFGVAGRRKESCSLPGHYHFKESFGGEFIEYVGEWDRPLSRPLYWLWEEALPAYRFFNRTMNRLFRK